MVPLDSPYLVSYSCLVITIAIGTNYSNWAPLRDIWLRNLSDIEFDLSNSLKVKCDGAIGLPIYMYDSYKCLIVSFGLTRPPFNI